MPRAVGLLLLTLLLEACSDVTITWPSSLAPGVITAGDDHYCALLENGSASCWGSNDEGEVGNGDSGTDVLLPSENTTLPS